MAAAQVAHFRSDSTSPVAPVTSTKGTRHHHLNNSMATAGPSSPTNNTTNDTNRAGTTISNNYGGVTALMLACQQGRSEDVQTILAKKSNAVKDRTRTGKVALHFCAESGSTSCLDYVLAAERFLINAQDEEGYTPLHLAVINGNKDIVRKLITAGADLNCLDNERHSLVHWATVCGEVDILEVLLSNGAPASTPDIHLAHPIHYASQMCGTINGVGSVSRARVQSTVYGVSPKKGLQILKRLIQFGCPIDVRDQDGRQPLLWASSAGSGDAILLLVNAGAKVDAEDKDGLSALHCAASRGHTDCLETLIALCGAEVDVIDNNGCTALFYAVTLGHADCTELLLNYGAEPNRQDRKGRTPGHCGAAKGQLETLKLLSRHGGNLWLRNVRGDLPLHEAVLSRRKDLVMWLLSQRPDAINMPNNDGRCPIHLAALNNNVEMVKILIDHRADINLLMRSGKGTAMTPLDAAMHKGNSAVAKFLQIHGGLPSNSLNDAALHRRMNRSVEGQISPASSMQGSHLGSHHHPSPEDQQRTFTSPEVFDNSLIQYSRNASYEKQGTHPVGPFIATSTPIMDDSVQTDAHYLRDMEVQVSDGFVKNEDNRKSRVTQDEYGHSHRKSERRRRRRSRHEDQSEMSSDSSLERSSNQLTSRASHKSSQKSRKGDMGSRSISHSHSSTRNSAEKADEETSSRATSFEKEETEVKRHSKGKKKNMVTPQGSSDTLLDNTMMSEKFSELENVGVQSSETDVREEELGPPGGVEQSKKVTEPKSVSKDKKKEKSRSKSRSVEKSVESGKDTDDEKGRQSESEDDAKRKRKPKSKVSDSEKDDAKSKAPDKIKKHSKSKSKSKSREESPEKKSKSRTSSRNEKSKSKSRDRSSSAKYHKDDSGKESRDSSARSRSASPSRPRSSSPRKSQDRESKQSNSKSRRASSNNKSRSPSPTRERRSSRKDSNLSARTPSGKRSSVSWHDEAESKSHDRSTSPTDRDKRSKSKSHESESKHRQRSESNEAVDRDRRSKSKSKDSKRKPQSGSDSAEESERSSKSKSVQSNSKPGESSRLEEKRSRSKSKSKESGSDCRDRSKSSEDRDTKSKSREEESKSRDGSKSPEKSDKRSKSKSPEKKDNRSKSKSPEKGDKRSKSKSPEKIDNRSKSKSPEKKDNRSKSKSPEKKDNRSKSKSPEKRDTRSKSKSQDTESNPRDRSLSEENKEKLLKSQSNSPDKSIDRSESSENKDNTVESKSPELNTKSRDGSQTPEDRDKISKSESVDREDKTRDRSNSPEKGLRSKSKSVESDKDIASEVAVKEPDTRLEESSLQSEEKETEIEQETNSEKDSETTSTEKTTEIERVSSGKLDIESQKSSRKSSSSKLQKSSKSSVENDEDEIIDEIEAGKNINLQEAARRRSESMARDPSRSRSRSLSKSRMNSDDSGPSKELSSNLPKNKFAGGTKSKAARTRRVPTSEEREIQLQEALLASSKKLRPKGSIGKVSKGAKTPGTGRLGSKRTTGKSILPRKSSGENDPSLSTIPDSGFSDPLGLTTSASEDHRTTASGQGKSHASMKRKVVTRRPGSGSVKRKTIFSSSPKQYRAPVVRNRFDTLIVHQLTTEVGGHDGDESNSTSTRGGSVTSEETGEPRSPRREPRRKPDLGRPRSRLTFSQGDDNTRLSPRPRKNTDVDTQISVTQAMQASMRKYNLERTIFQELLELKRIQIRAGKANEQLLVKRLADNYKKAGYSVNFRDYDGPYTFRNFEKYLYDQLRLLQSNRRLLPRFAPSDDIEKLSMALKKMNATKLPYLEETERTESACDHVQCSHTTHRCHHAAHAYTGVPCAAYIGSRKNGFLPRVNPIKAPGPTQKDSISRSTVGNGSRNGLNDSMNLSSPMQISISPRTDTQSPITLEVQQGANTQVFTLPTKSLDPSKNYYVSLSIKPNPTTPGSSPAPSGDSMTQRPSPGDVIDDGSISAPPPPAENDRDVQIDVERDKHNRSM